MAIDDKVIEVVGKELYSRALKVFPEDVINKLKKAMDEENNELARVNLEAIIENIQIAKQDNCIICQDTCIASFKVKVGLEAKIEGDIINALKRGTEMATRDVPLIPHCVHPITRINTGTGSGPHVPLLHFEVLPGADYIEITALPVGGGGDIVSALKMFSALDSFSLVKKFIIDTVAEANGKPCPPIIVGIGLGSQFEMVCKLAKEAALRPLSIRHPEKEIAMLEEELLSMINQIGIGPMGMGGKTTCLAVNIEYGNTHTPMLPVAVKIQCWCARRATARIYDNGRVEYIN